MEHGKSTKKWPAVGPGLIVAATGVGAGDLVAALVAGTNFGLVFLWAIIIGAILKFALNEGVGRYHLLTGKTILEGWHSMGLWATSYFGVYSVIWGFVYGAAATSSCALALSALFPVLPLWVWAVISGLLGFLLTWMGQYKLFEKVMNLLILLMFISVVGSAVIVLPELSDIIDTAVPTLPKGSLLYALGLIGGVGGSITMASYGYWLQENNWKDRSYLRYVRFDSMIAYITTAVFTISLLILGAALLYGTNTNINGEQGLVSFATILGNELSSTVRILFLIGFWSASFTSVLGVWNGVSYLFADFVYTVKKHDVNKEQLSKTKAYKFFVFWLTFPPMLLHFIGKPVSLIILYGALGALFMPFLALTLIYLLNSKKHLPHKEDRNKWFFNVLLSLNIVLFFILSINELVNLFR
ncbi:Nramp family divalent metal transporter [Aeribacillus sp. FSL K6-2848]|uniref:Nramp family divalent metal transporter n=1 Tax=Aeribacillus TaxID=1055323 RepID=UPI0007B46562|nr:MULTISPECIES: Nramp family divalent metal transporter [Aeribacillus]KZM54881.1 iron transporter [Aeribacillus pallidus]MED0652191.1 Nramp family divalent metal transporter [Aeribacillus composti]MED0714800.1 Nramp family divalent metal transporter [Aeribacillus composti]MED0745423.1 Nramp family divalent metal transporter [Aeribacillus composti]MED4488448.1 Nramp family divalent metal transporter [Aeribacillus pallidus]